MDDTAADSDKRTTFTVLVTGANRQVNGLGFGICCRLVDEFLYTRPQWQTLHLLFSTRDTKKSNDTLRRLNAHLQRTLAKENAKTPGFTSHHGPRIKLEGVQVDLTRLLTVKALAKQLISRRQRIDAIVCNAGISGFERLDVWKLLKQLITAFTEALTYPNFQVCRVGALTKPQLSGHGTVHTFPEPRLGEIFAANVFGHYMLVHWLAPIMSPWTRTIWVSSIGALASHFSVDDLQGLSSPLSYESSKRLTDLLILTSGLPSTKPYVESYLPSPGLPPPNAREAEQQQQQPRERPRLYVTHPGVVGTNIYALPSILAPLIVWTFCLCRLLGSPWHPIAPYKGAVSMVHAALCPDYVLPAQDELDGKGKWGSATNVFGEERVARTEVEGWGYSGEVGEKPTGSIAAVRKGYSGTTKEMREQFEEAGRRAWREMEELRVAWEKLLGPI